MRPFQLDPFSVVGILPADDLVDEAAIGVEIVEVPAAAHQRGVLQRHLQMAVRAFACAKAHEPAQPALALTGLSPAVRN